MFYSKCHVRVLISTESFFTEVLVVMFAVARNVYGEVVAGTHPFVHWLLGVLIYLICVVLLQITEQLFY